MDEIQTNIPPAEKLNILFLKLYELQLAKGIGRIIDVRTPFYKENLWRDWGFETLSECNLYFNVLIEDDLINTPTKYEFHITFKGINKALQLTEEGINSSNCFVAMSFDLEEDILFYEAIAPACDETGFKAIRVDQQHLHSEQTINDGIIAGIKQSRFMIADFTKQKDGVYFEAGYALGRGLKVIYSCRRDHFKDSHFDTNHFPHIIYDTPEELKSKLIDKIEAWIKD